MSVFLGGFGGKRGKTLGLGSPSVVSKSDSEASVRLVALIRGRVQGVGFRWWTRTRALELGLTGWARNLADGRVEVVAEGPRSHCECLVQCLRSRAAPGRVDAVQEIFEPALGDLVDFITG